MNSNVLNNCCRMNKLRGECFMGKNHEIQRNIFMQMQSGAENCFLGSNDQN